MVKYSLLIHILVDHGFGQLLLQSLCTMA